MTERVKKSNKIVQIQEEQCMTERPKVRDADTCFTPEQVEKEVKDDLLRINISQLNKGEVLPLSIRNDATVYEVKEKLMQLTQVDEAERLKLI